MSMHKEQVRFGPSNEYSGLAMWPERAALPLPAVIVIQEAWGVNAHIEDVTQRFAQAGYVAFAPDLFAMNGQRLPSQSHADMDEALAFINQAGPTVFMDAAARAAALAKLPEAKAKQVGDTMQALLSKVFGGLGSYVPHVVEAAKFLRTFPASKGMKIASTGYCMGGGISVLLACHDPQLAGAVAYYGSPGPDAPLSNIQCPVLMFNASLDARLIAGLPAFTEAMKKNGKSLESHVYEGALHAFFNDTRPSYNANAVRDSFARTLEFFRRVLG